MSVTMDYFYGKEAEQFAFFTVPKILFEDKQFKSLAAEAKMLYGMMLDRMSLSIANNWFDKEGRAYIYVSTEFIIDKFGCGRNKALNHMKALEEYGLIERIRHGQGKASSIYVKKFVLTEERGKSELTEDVSDDLSEENSTADMQEKTGKKESGSENKPQNFNSETSKSLPAKLQEVYLSNTNNTDINNTDYSDTESNHIVSTEDLAIKTIRSDSDRITASVEQKYADIIRENIGLDQLMDSHSTDRDMILGIYELIVETVLPDNDRILIASSWYPAELVKSRFLKLDYSHIEYVLECFRKNTSQVGNIKKYPLAAIFNAPTTMSGYYTARVNHDFPQYAG